MIDSKEKLKYYLECDRIALGIKKKRPSFIIRGAQQEIWRFEIILRKLEYCTNCHKNLVIKSVYRFLFSRASIALGFTIPINVFGPGLSIAHIGTIVINSNSRVGKNCRIQTGVTLGSTNGSGKSPKVGDNVFLGDGCKLIGDISIADNVCIGANAVVIKSIDEPSTTWGGVPARLISQSGSGLNVIKATELYKETLK